jgi:hypothetical protein
LSGYDFSGFSPQKAPAFLKNGIFSKFNFWHLVLYIKCLFDVIRQYLAG